MNSPPAFSPLQSTECLAAFDLGAGSGDYAPLEALPGFPAGLECENAALASVRQSDGGPWAVAISGQRGVRRRLAQVWCSGQLEAISPPPVQNC